MSESILNNSTLSRYELIVDGHVAFVKYRLSPGTIDFVHTEVPKELAGRGIGALLAKGVLDAARAQGLKVIATCPFIAGYIKKHSEFADLLG